MESFATLRISKENCSDTRKCMQGYIQCCQSRWRTVRLVHHHSRSTTRLHSLTATVSQHLLQIIMALALVDSETGAIVNGYLFGNLLFST